MTKAQSCCGQYMSINNMERPIIISSVFLVFVSVLCVYIAFFIYLEYNAFCYSSNGTKYKEMHA